VHTTRYNYVNILAETGTAGVKLFAKQAFDDFFVRANPHKPTASFWAALLWKRFMGTSVYSASVNEGAKGTTTASTTTTTVVAARSLRNGTRGATLAVVNLADTERTFSIVLGGGGGFDQAQSQSPSSAASSLSCELFLVEPETDPSGAYAMINGQHPPYDSTTGEVPLFAGTLLPSCASIALPSLTVAFVVAVSSPAPCSSGGSDSKASTTSSAHLDLQNVLQPENSLSRTSCQGELLYNGICLPSPWPPNRSFVPGALPGLIEPPAPSYLEDPPSVINISVGRQLFVDDFLINTSTLSGVSKQFYAAE
jgi:hypothetical protein